VTAGIVEARHEFDLYFGEPAAGRLKFDRKTLKPRAAAVWALAWPKQQQVANAGQGAHALENCTGARVSFSLVGDVKPQHIGMHSQAEMLRERRLQGVFGLPATGECIHRDPPRFERGGVPAIRRSVSRQL
jgi:hypothetical protein